MKSSWWWKLCIGSFGKVPEPKSYEQVSLVKLTLPWLTRFRRTSDGDVIPGPEQGFDIVGGYFSADLKSFLSHPLNLHFPITRSSMAFLKIKVMLLS